MYEEMKLKNSDSIVIIKQANFYVSYGEDARMLNYLFKYELKEIDDEIGVRFTNITKVIQKLDNLEINYVVVGKKTKRYKNNKYKTILKLMKIVNKLSNLKNNNLIDNNFYLLKS